MLMFSTGFYLCFYLLWSFYLRGQSSRAARRAEARNTFVFEIMELVKGFAIFVGPIFAFYVGVSRYA